MLAFIAIVACAPVVSTTEPNSSRLNWQQCEEIDIFECAKLPVPVDYNNLAGEWIALSLIRKLATGGKAERSILVNPGGPGGSGVSLVKFLDELNSIPEKIANNFNIVGFDPRGVGGSTPVHCSEFDLSEFNPYPNNENDLRKIFDYHANFSAKCFQKYGDYLRHLGSLNVVHDMNEIRKALGEDKLNFIGYSYGTRLAALHLQQYPTTSGRIILDASVHPESSTNRLLRDSLKFMQLNLLTLVSNCPGLNDHCDANAQLDTLNNHLLILANDQSLHSQFELSLLSDILLNAANDVKLRQRTSETIFNYLENPDSGILIQMFEQLQLEGLISDHLYDDQTAYIAILCADDKSRPTPDSLLNQLNDFNQISDIAAELQILDAANCAGWPVSSTPLQLITTDIAPMSLVIGGTNDVQTPIQWSEAMADSIGGYFLVSEHHGHTSVFNGVSECIDTVVENYLLDGLKPALSECTEIN